MKKVFLEWRNIDILNNVHTNISSWIHVYLLNASALRLRLRNSDGGAAAAVGERCDQAPVISQLFLWHHSCTIYVLISTHPTVCEKAIEWVRFIYFF